MRFAFACAAFAAAMGAAAEASAAPECLANGQSFKIGQTACLTPPGKSYLARCDMVLNNTSWVKIADDCRQSGLPSQEGTQPSPEPASPADKPDAN